MYGILYTFRLQCMSAKMYSLKLSLLKVWVLWYLMSTPGFCQHRWSAVYQGPTSLMNSSSILRIRWKFSFGLFKIVMKRLLQKFAHDMTAVLSCHVQTFCSEMISWDGITLKPILDQICWNIITNSLIEWALLLQIYTETFLIMFYGVCQWSGWG